ncbi:MAG: PaaI family thioesterase [Halieaceae bacterium]|nr:PaaI family thioesterase [Halieaceae bacterium]
MTPIFERIRKSFNQQSFMQTLGAELVAVKDGTVTIELPFSEVLCQQQGFLHAGVVATLADNVCGYAALTQAPDGADVVTAEFKINFVRPAIGERLVAVGKVETVGKRLCVCRGEVSAISQGNYKVVAIIQATVAVV